MRMATNMMNSEQEVQDTEFLEHIIPTDAEKEAIAKLYNLNTEEEEEEFVVKDTVREIDITLREAYTGTTKKLLIERSRFNNTDKLVKKMKKFEIVILPGTVDGKQFIFKEEGDEQAGYTTGDVVVTINILDDPVFERLNNDLIMCVNVGLFEAYYCTDKIIIEHLNGGFLHLNPTYDNEPLYTRNGVRRVTGGGMPSFTINDETGNRVYGDLFIRFNLVLPSRSELTTLPAATSASGETESVVPIKDGDVEDVIKTLFPILVENTRLYDLSIIPPNSTISRAMMEIPSLLVTPSLSKFLRANQIDDE